MRASRNLISAISVVLNDTPTLCVGELHSKGGLIPRRSASGSFIWLKQRQEVTEYIGELYQKNGNPQKTMQEHHWIEQSRIKNTKTYPFLSCPPMKEDLLKSKSNLSLIVGHNGGHKKTYNDLLDDKLDYIADFLGQMSKDTGIPVSDLLKKENIIVEINNQVRQIIMDLSNSVKKDHTIMNNVEKMFVLD